MKIKYILVAGPKTVLNEFRDLLSQDKKGSGSIPGLFLTDVEITATGAGPHYSEEADESDVVSFFNPV